MDESAFNSRQLGGEGYLHLYPLVTIEVSRRQLVPIEAGKMPDRIRP